MKRRGISNAQMKESTGNKKIWNLLVKEIQEIEKPAIFYT